MILRRCVRCYNFARMMVPFPVCLGSLSVIIGLGCFVSVIAWFVCAMVVLLCMCFSGGVGCGGL